MADKFIVYDSSTGGLKQREATAASTGVSEAGDVVALDGTGRIAQSMMPVGVAADTASIETSDDLSAGDFVNIHDATGIKCRLADNGSSDTEAVGFVLASTTTGQNATVYFEGTNTQVTGATVGAIMYLGTAGAVVASPPTGTGDIVQKIGRAISTTSIAFEATNPIELV